MSFGRCECCDCECDCDYGYECSSGNTDNSSLEENIIKVFKKCMEEVIDKNLSNLVSNKIKEYIGSLPIHADDAIEQHLSNIISKKIDSYIRQFPVVMEKAYQLVNEKEEHLKVVVKGVCDLFDKRISDLEGVIKNEQKI